MKENTPKSRSRVIRCREYEWEGKEKHRYKTEGGGFRDIHRISLLGEELTDLNFHTRYFEIAPGGYSSLEQHRHPHSVVVIRGSGSVVLDDELLDIGLHDVVCIAPDTLHQFHADRGEKLGFLCMVDRYRDKPALPDRETIERRIRSPETRKKLRI